MWAAVKRTAEHHRSGGKRLLLLKMRLSCETAGERGDAGIHQPSFISSVRLLRLTPSNFTGFKLCSTSANTSTCLFCSARNVSVTPPEPQTHTNQKRTRLLLFLQHRVISPSHGRLPALRVRRWSDGGVTGETVSPRQSPDGLSTPKLDVSELSARGLKAKPGT